MIDKLEICDAVNWQIQLSGIDPVGASTVKNCVARYTRYSNGENLSQKIQYYFNRMCNAIKSVFGQSDWQLAERAIVQHVYAYVPEICRDFVKNRTQGIVHHLAGRSLRLLVVQNNNKLAVPNYVKSIVEGQLLVAKLVLTQVALKTFQKSCFLALNFMNAFYHTQHYAQWSFRATPINIGGFQINENRTSTYTLIQFGGQPNTLVPMITRALTELRFSQNRLLLING